MIKKIHKYTKHHLNKEVNSSHLFVIFVLPVAIFSLLYLYTKALQTEFISGADVHTRIMYFDGNFSQDLAIDTIDTSTYVINQSEETVRASVYEYNNPNTNNNTVNVVNINKFSEKLLTTAMPSLIVLTTDSQNSTSTVLVGENNRLDNDRYIFLKNSILNQINNKNINSLRYAFMNLKKLHKVDINIRNNCESLINDMAKIAIVNFTNVKAKAIKDDFCNNTYAKALIKLEPKIIDIKNNVLKYGNTIEITLPDLSPEEKLK